MDRLIRRRELEQITGKSRSAIYADMARDIFPRPVRIGKRSVGWRSSEIEAWLHDCDQA